MRKENLKLWMAVVLHAVIIGLSVTYLLQTMMPQTIVGWLLWILVCACAGRSILRIAALAKQAGKDKE